MQQHGLCMLGLYQTVHLSSVKDDSMFAQVSIINIELMQHVYCPYWQGDTCSYRPGLRCIQLYGLSMHSKCEERRVDINRQCVPTTSRAYENSRLFTWPAIAAPPTILDPTNFETQGTQLFNCTMCHSFSSHGNIDLYSPLLPYLILCLATGAVCFHSTFSIVCNIRN